MCVCVYRLPATKSGPVVTRTGTKSTPNFKRRFPSENRGRENVESTTRFRSSRYPTRCRNGFTKRNWTPLSPNDVELRTRLYVGYFLSRARVSFETNRNVDLVICRERKRPESQRAERYYYFVRLTGTLIRIPSVRHVSRSPSTNRYIYWLTWPSAPENGPRSILRTVPFVPSHNAHDGDFHCWNSAVVA